ncbi:MAG: PTS sugar transporter subunit IIC [Solobacterium sp.]|nr:PTS sugar transporter subunit IIC [Solobacterium sp.]
MDQIQSFMERFIGPLAAKMNASKTIQAIASGMMGTMPVSLGVTAICVLFSLPIPGLSEMASRTGLALAQNEIMMVTLSATAIYMVINIAYNYAKSNDENGMTCATISLAAFLMMMPVFIFGENYFLRAIQTQYIGADGIFVGMIMTILVSKAYCFLMKKNLKLRLPDSVPPNVSNSLSPIFVSMIILTSVFVLKYLFSLTSYGNIFNLFNTLISTPFMKFGSSPAALIFIYTFASMMWFFGVHPSPIISVYSVVMTTVAASNTAAFTAGEVMPYVYFQIIYYCLYFSGTGNTIGLSLCLQKAKSERLKALRAITLVPNLFNINEPVIFGVPVMLNPLFFIPMILNTLIPGLIGVAASKLMTFNYNPTITMPWVTPAPITGLLVGGIPLFLLILFCVAVTTLIWYPFFKMADNQALKEEAAAAD